MSRFRFVADHQHAYGVKRLCEVLQIARSSFYAWLDGQPRRAQRATADAELAETDPCRARAGQHPGAPRITAELNDGAPPGAGQPQAGRPGDAEHDIAGLRLRRRVRTTVPEPAARRCPTCSSATSPPTRRTSATSATSPTCPGRRREPVPGDGDRLLLPPAGGVGDRRAHAHRAGRRRAHRGPRHAGLAGRCGVPLRPRRAVHLEGLRPALREPGGDPVDGRGRHQRRQRAGRVLQRHPQTRDSSRARTPGRTRHLPPPVFGWVTRYNTRRRHSYGGQQAPIVYEQQHTATLRLAG